MKKIQDIAVTFVLSFMVVFLSAGMPIMSYGCAKCCHADLLPLALSAEKAESGCKCCCKKQQESHCNNKPEGCQKQTGCSSVKIAKLSSSIPQPSHEKTAVPVFTLPPARTYALSTTETGRKPARQGIPIRLLRHGTPRDHLASLCILLI